MRSFKFFGAVAFACAAFVAACASSPGSSPTTDKGPSPGQTDVARGVDTSMLPADCKLSESVKVDGAVIYAIVSRAAVEDTDYLTLDEAMKLKVATVKEVGADEGGEEEVSGEVNTLLVSNSSDRPLFLMAGDLMLGGKQDRILAESVVVAPRTANQPIPVFCVEQGRWELQDKDAERVSGGAFYTDAATGQADLAVKKAALESKSQGEVWRKVADNNTALGVSGETSSGTFRATFENKATQEKIEGSFAKARELAKPGVIGYAVFVDGKMVAMDVFDSSKLTVKLSDKLLRSYIVTGLSGGYTAEVVEAERRAASRANGPRMLSLDGTTEDTRTGSGNHEAEERPADRGVRNNTGPSGSGRAPVDSERTLDAERVETAKVNDRTETTRDYKKDSLKYEVKDKETGKPVQRSFMRR